MKQIIIATVNDTNLTHPSISKRPNRFDSIFETKRSLRKAKPTNKKKSIAGVIK